MESFASSCLRGLFWGFSSTESTSFRYHLAASYQIDRHIQIQHHNGPFKVAFIIFLCSTFLYGTQKTPSWGVPTVWSRLRLRLRGEVRYLKRSDVWFWPEAGRRQREQLEVDERSCLDRPNKDDLDESKGTQDPKHKLVSARNKRKNTTVYAKSARTHKDASNNRADLTGKQSISKQYRKLACQICAAGKS